MCVALIGLRRFDKAVSAARKAVSQNPLFPFAYSGLASALAHRGREAEAREAVAALLEHDPDFRISERIVRGDAVGLQLYVEGLRKAGLPE
jgi:adenylate cyclase